MALEWISLVIDNIHYAVISISIYIYLNILDEFNLPGWSSKNVVKSN